MKYQQSNGAIFSVTNQAATSTTAAFATTFTGLSLANPTGSGVNLILRRFTCAQVAAAVAGAVGIMSGAGAAAGSITPTAMTIGSAQVSKAVGSAGATIATPVLVGAYGTLGSQATTGFGIMPGIVVELDGSIIVPPGFFVASYTTAATTNALIFGFVYEEVAIAGGA
jgi:hypothetical protein